MKADKPLGQKFAELKKNRTTGMQTNRLTTTQTEQPIPAELGLTMTRILKNPLAALRASMENLAHDLPANDPRSEHVDSALAEVQRLARGVQDLVDYAAPREMEPLSCSSDELLFSTLRMLPLAARSRVRLARCSTIEGLWVDGPQLCQSLRHLADYALATTSGEVLLGARQEENQVLFSLVGEASAAKANDSVQLDLGLHLAGRDIPRMGGALTLQRSSRGATCIQVSLPLSTRSEANA